MTSAAVLAAFEAFWLAYPARPDNPKAAARLVFERRVREGADPAAIIAAAARYAAHAAARKLDSTFIPHARTWLSQRRWEDYPEAAPAPARADPHAGHALAWLRPAIGDDAWLSWIAPIAVEPESLTFTARTRVAADHVDRMWRALIKAHYGRPYGWIIRKD